MGKVIGGLIVVVGIWCAVEMVTEGPSRAFDGLFAGFMGSSDPEPIARERSTAQRAGDSVERARDAASARRERMLAE